MEDDGPPGVPEWVVTYGDMMSLLLTFFIMLVSLSEVVADKKFRAMLESLNQRFGYHTSAPAAPGKNFPLNSMLEKLTTLGAYTDADDGRGGIKTRGVAGVDFRVFRNRAGDGLPVGEPLHFPADRTEPTDEMSPLLDDVGRRLAGMPNKVEVHGLVAAVETSDLDDPQVETGRRNRCFERARAVRAALVARGVEPDRVRIVVDTRHVEHDPTHELTPGARVQVFVLDTHTSDFVGKGEG